MLNYKKFMLITLFTIMINCLVSCSVGIEDKEVFEIKG